MQVVCNLKSRAPCFYPMILTALWQEKGVLLFPFHGWAPGAGAHGGGAQPARFSSEGGGPESVWMDYMTPTRGAARRRAPLSQYNRNSCRQRGCLGRQYPQGRPSRAAPLKYEARDAAMPCRVRAGGDQDIITRKARGMWEDAALEMD